MGAENIPGAVDRTGGIWLFDRKLRSWDSFAGDILATRENMWSLVSCDIYRQDISLFLGRIRIILGDLDLVFGGVESNLDSRSAFLKLSSSLSKL